MPVFTDYGHAFICSTHPTKLKRIPAKAGILYLCGRRSGPAHTFLFLRDCRLLVDQRQCLHRCGRGSKHLLFPTHVRKPDAPALIILGLHAGVPAGPNRDLLLGAVIDHQHAAIWLVVLPEAGRRRRREPRSRHDLGPSALIDPTGIGRSRGGRSRGDRRAAAIAGASTADANSAATAAATANIGGLVDGLIDGVARAALVDLVGRPASLVGLVAACPARGASAAIDASGSDIGTCLGVEATATAKAARRCTGRE